MSELEDSVFKRGQIWENPDGMCMEIVAVKHGLVYLYDDSNNFGWECDHTLEQWMNDKTMKPKAPEPLHVDETCKENSETFTQMQQCIRDMAGALNNISQEAANYIGCRCGVDDCEPGDCWPCRMVGIIDMAETAREDYKQLIEEIG